MTNATRMDKYIAGNWWPWELSKKYKGISLHIGDISLYDDGD